METRYFKAIDIEGEVIAWTPRAVLVRAILAPGKQPQNVWVWASAVKRM